MPNTTTPLPENSRANWLSDGVSWTQGGHQVAQKFKTSSLPPKSGTETDRPLSVAMVNPGAASPATTTRSWMEA